MYTIHPDSVLPRYEAIEIKPGNFIVMDHERKILIYMRETVNIQHKDAQLIDGRVLVPIKSKVA